MKKKIISVFLVVVILFSVFAIPYQEAKAFDLVITPTVAVSLLVGTMIVATGVALANDEDLQSAVNIAWNKATVSTREKLAVIAAGLTWGAEAVTGVEIASPDWNGFTDWLSLVFSDSSMERIGGIGDYYSTSLAASSVPVTAWQPFATVPNATGTYTYAMGTSTVTYAIGSTSTTVSINLADGALITGTNSMYGGISGGQSIDICTPIVSTSSGADSFYLPMRSLISGTSYHNYFVSNWKYNGFLLSYSNGRVWYNSGSVVYLSAENEFPSISAWLFHYLAYGSSFAVTVDPEQRSTVMDIPEEKEVTLNVPNTLTGVRTAEWADTVGISDVSNVPNEFPESNTSDETANKFKVPGEVIMTKFPFCIPFDVMRAFETLKAPAVVPYFEIPFSIASLGFSQNIVIDFSQFDNLAQICRWFFSVIFLLGLILITRKLIM